MPDNISEILDPSVNPELKELNQLLQAAVTNIENVGKAAKGITIDFKGVKDIATLNELVAKKEAALKQMEDAEDKYRAARESKEEKALQAQIKREYDRELAAKKAIAAKLVEEDKVAAAKIKNAEKEEAILNKIIAAEERAAEKQNLIKQRQLKQIEIAAGKEAIAVNKAAEQATKAAEQKALAAEQAAAREEKAMAKLNNAYEQLKIKYKQAADEAKRLGAEFGVTDSRAVAAAASSMKLYNSLLAVEKSVGQAQRQVGQYNMAAQAMTQVLREMPNFALGARIGILSLSNNIPMLVDEIKNLQAANAALTASGGKAIPVWKTLLSSITSPVGMITIATTAATFLAVQWDNIAKYFKTAGDELKEFTATATESAGKERANAAVLASIAKDTKKSMDLRIQAVDQLQSKYPDYLGNLSKEAILSGDVADAMERLNAALINKAIMEAYTEKVGEQAKKFVELKQKQTEYTETLVELNAKQEKALNNLNKVQYGKGEGAGALVQSLKNQINATKNDLADTLKQIGKVQAEMRKAQEEANKFGGLAAPLLLSPNKTKGATGKSPSDTTLKSENDLIKAQYELARQRLEHERDNQKAISDNLDNELGDRLVAHQEYMNALMQLSLLERDRDIAIENEKLTEITRLRKTSTGAADENLLKQDEAARTRIQEAREGHEFRLSNITRTGKNDTISIIASANGEWIKSEEERNAKAKQVQAAFLYMEETNLHKAYKDKLISRKEYNSELAALQKEQQIFAIDSEIAFDKTILDNKNISAEKRKQFEEKLAKDLKTKAGLVKGEAAPKKSTGRLTDGLAKALGGGDMEDADLEQYQQEFWNRTVDLANKATDAIIAARNRQYDNERAQLEAQSEQIRINADTQTAIINATTQNDIQRQNMLTQLAIQTQAQQQVIEAKKRDISKKQAAFEKTAAVASIIQSTAVAIAAALKYPPPAAAVIIGLISTASAVQLAAVASAPTPAYKFGTDNHPGGAFIAGDGGVPELIIAPNKAPYFSKSVSTLYNEPAGTKVLPPDVIKFAAASTGILPQAYNDAIIDKVATKITKEFGSVGMQLSEVIWAARSKPANMDALAEQMRRERNLQGY